MSPDRKHLLSLFLDDYGSGLDQGFLIAGGVASWGAGATEGSAARFRQLRKDDTKFNRKGHDWRSTDFPEFVDFVARSQLLPVAGYVRTDSDVLSAVRKRARKTRFGTESPRAVRPIQWLWIKLLPRVLAGACVASLIHFSAPVHRLRVVVEQGNMRIDQEDGFRREVATLTGEYCYQLAPGELPSAESCAWDQLELSFEKRHELLKVADVYVAMVSRYLRGCATTTEALRHLDATFAYRGPKQRASFSFFDVTPEIRTDLGL